MTLISYLTLRFLTSHVRHGKIAIGKPHLPNIKFLLYQRKFLTEMGANFDLNNTEQKK